MSNEQHVSEAAGAYVLGALTAQEAQDVEVHAATCEQCRRDINDLRQVVSVLPLACEPVEPSHDLRARILAAGKGDDQVDAILRRAVVTSSRHEPKRDFWHRSWPAWAGIAGWSGLAAACGVAAGILIGVGGERQRMLALAPQPQPQARNMAAEAPRVLGKVTTVTPLYAVNADQIEQAVALIGHSQVWDLSLSKTGDRIPCKVIQPRNASHAMIVSDMPATRNGMVYQVWLLRKGKIHKGAVVMPGRMVQTTIPMKVQRGDVIAFSMEPAGGSALPTGGFVMQQTL